MLLICRDFIVTYILAVIALVLLTVAIESLLATDLGNAFNIIPQIVGALVAGQRYGKRTGTRPESRFAWQAAFWMTMISVTLSVGLAFGFVAYMGPGDAAPLLSFFQDQMTLIIAIFAVVIVVYLLATRYFFGMGAKQGAAASGSINAEIFR